MAPSMPARHVCDTLNMAIQQRRPAPGPIAHSDRRSQYASVIYQDLLSEHGFVDARGQVCQSLIFELFVWELSVQGFLPVVT
jgi:putative transposase